MTGKTMTARKPTRFEMGFLLLFHAVLSGAFLVAYLTGDEDTYGMHLFAGYTVLVALGARLAAARLAPAGGPLALPRPATSLTLAWLRGLVAGDRPTMRARSPLYPWMAAVMLAFAALVAGSGWIADRLPSAEELHEAVAELTPAVIVAHVATAAALQWLRRVAAAREAAAPSTAEPTSVSAG
jgi:cytochrome b